jgi:hypothetical protein
VATSLVLSLGCDGCDTASCVVSLIDRLMHRAEVVRTDGDSYRAKDADEHDKLRQAQRSAKAAAARPRKVVKAAA